MEKNHHNADPVSDEALLRFLDTVPGRIRSNHPQRPAMSGPTDSCGCPSVGSYMGIALGTAEPGETRLLLDHAAACGICANVLAETLRVLDGNAGAEEAVVISELSGQHDWQKQMAADLAASTAPNPPFPLLSAVRNRQGRQWLLAGLAAALAALAAGGVLWQRRAASPEALLARAYQQARTLELRIPRAGYAAMAGAAHTRGAGDGEDDEAAPLLEARAGLALALQHTPQNPHLLELEARADLLEEHYDRAVDLLERLLASGQSTPELLTDAASAHYQRGLVANRELDRSTALEYLHRADLLAPADPVVLFNEAVVMEDRGQMMNAVEVWNRYLNVERDRGWAAEGRRRRAALEATLSRIRSHQSRVEQMLATPAAMNALSANPGKLAGFDEELSTTQLMRLTATAYPESPNPESPNPAPASTAPASPGKAGHAARGSPSEPPCPAVCTAARRLLQAIARSLERQHHDSWLLDLLSPTLDNPSLPPAIQGEYSQAMRLLGVAVHDDQFDMADTGKAQAAEARAIFARLRARAGSAISLRQAMQAGEDRAGAEYLFALQRLTDYKGCRDVGRQLQARPELQPETTRYPWIESSALIAQMVCEEEPETRLHAEKLRAPALQLAQAAGYPELQARVETMIAGQALDAGDQEGFERQLLAIIRRLAGTDSSPLRIAHTLIGMPLAEEDSSRAHMVELGYREAAQWHGWPAIPPWKPRCASMSP